MVFKPSAAEVAEHVRTHVPYRTWCPYCVAGRGHAVGTHRWKMTPSRLLNWLSNTLS